MANTLTRMLRSILFCAAAAAVAACASAVEQDDPFWSGYVKSSDIHGLQGVYADGGRAIAWTSSAYWLSEDAGNRWSDLRMPYPGLATASMPGVIAQCVVIGSSTWIRLADGRLLDAAGNPGNPLLGGLACSRIAVDGQGIMYAERGDGQLTVASTHGAVTAQAPGRIVAIFDRGAVVKSDREMWLLSAAGIAPLARLQDSGPGNWPTQSGPGGAVWRDVQGAGWELDRGSLMNTGRLHNVRVMSQGRWPWEDRLLCLLDSNGRIDITSSRPQDLLRSGEWMRDAPAGIVAVAGVLDPEFADSRQRLVVAAQDGLWIWRGR
jgi:hypothetical protein